MTFNTCEIQESRKHVTENINTFSCVKNIAWPQVIIPAVYADHKGDRFVSTVWNYFVTQSIK